MGDGMAPQVDGVEGRLRNLKLTDAEKKSIKIGKKQSCSPEVSKLQAVGKLLSEKPAKAEYLGRALSGAWCPFSRVECKGLGRNRFLFQFHDDVSKNKAIRGGPWMFNKDLLVMEDFVPSKTIDDYEFKSIPIWVRAYGIPMGMMSTETGELVGDQIGEFLDVDLDDNGSAVGVFMRIKVKMDITVPIMRFITIEIEEEQEEEQGQVFEEMMGVEDIENKKKKIVSFEYEHLPDFCYNCGIIGHTERACPSRTKREGDRQFGPWLRAIMYNGSSSDERSRSSSDRGDFWATHSAGSKGSKHGSDGPSWRKSLPAGTNGDKSERRGEEKEVTSPLKPAKDDMNRGVRGKELVFEENKQPREITNLNLRPSPCKKTAHSTVSELVSQEKEMPKSNLAELKIGQEEKERSQRKEDEHNEESNRGIRPGKILKLGTFKRRERTKEKLQKNEPFETILKKRNADMMNVDLEAEILKRARMEVDGELATQEGNEGNTKTDGENAGLQGQPGESK